MNINKQKSSNISNGFPCALITIAGITFWFFLIFPFEHHNESYHWTAVLMNTTFIQALTENIFNQPNFRLMTNVIAYSGYVLSGGGIYIHQIFNYILAAAAWFIITLLVKEKKVFSIVGFIIGGFFFSGYIYLFHIHGVNYSPIFLLIAGLYYLFENNDKNIIKRFIIAFLLAIIASLFHPSALLVFLSFLIGFSLTHLRKMKLKHYILGILLIVFSGILILSIKSSRHNPSLISNLKSFLTSYTLIEIHPLISLISFSLIILTVLSIDTLKQKSKIIVVVISICLSGLLFYFRLPIVLLWVLISLLKMIYIRKWSIALLILFTLPLPMGLLTGTPTYTIYTIFACTIALADNWESMEKRIAFLNYKSVILTYSLCIILIIVLRIGIHIPGIYQVTQPLQAEREKTYQLKTIITWIEESEYNHSELILYRDKASPYKDFAGTINRKNIPPTSQKWLDFYMKTIRKNNSNSKAPSQKLIITFGNDSVDNMKLIKSINGKFAGKAMVFHDQ